MKRLMLICLAAMSLAACAPSGSPGGGATTAAVATKTSIFNSWTHKTAGVVLDLRGGTLNSASGFNFLFANGAACGCNVVAYGTESSGNYAVTSCAYYPGTGPGNPGCSSLNEGGTFAITSGALLLCATSGASSGACSDYK